MGSGVGGALKKNGLRVLTALDGRSDESRQRAAEEGFEDVGSLDELAAFSMPRNRVPACIGGSKYGIT